MTAPITTLAGAATAWRNGEAALRQAQKRFHKAIDARVILADLVKEAQARYRVQDEITEGLLKKLTTWEQAIAQAAEIWGNLKAAEDKK